MSEPGWNKPTSPFHAVARKLQERLGLRERIEKFGRRGIRDYMTEEVRTFVAQLPFLVIAALDRAGRPWATIVSGAPGFAAALDTRTLEISTALHPADPLAGALAAGARISVLGIEFPTRRRNTVNGRIVSYDGGTLRIRAEQCFGNCPRYIRARTIERGSAASPPPPHTTEPHPLLEPAEESWIGTADTFFIASSHPDDDGNPVHGIDVSHRGGFPGFIDLEDDRTLIWPEFVGNSQFNTLGNILANPRIGLLFPDFDSGDGLYLTGRAEIAWESGDVALSMLSDRKVRFYAIDIVRLGGILAAPWRAAEIVPTPMPGNR